MELPDSIDTMHNDIHANPRLALAFRVGANIVSTAKVFSSVYTAVNTAIEPELPYLHEYQTWGDATLNAAQELSDKGDGILGRQALRYGRAISRVSSMMDDVGDKIGYHAKSVGRIIRDTKNANSRIDKAIALANITPQSLILGRDVAMTYKRIKAPPKVNVAAKQSGKMKATLMGIEHVIGASPLSKKRAVRVGLLVFKGYNTYYSVKSFIDEQKDYKEQERQLLMMETDQTI